MSEFAVHVPTWEDYLKLNIDPEYGIEWQHWQTYGENTCVRTTTGKQWVYCDVAWYVSHGTDIISVDEYLNMKQGKSEMKENLVTALATAEILEDAVNRGLEAAKEKLEQDTNSAESTNPKRQFGLASIPLHLWSPLASAYGSLGLYNGSLKYGRNNFKATPVEASIYIAAAMRHLSAWAEGEEYDPADGVPNLGGVLANIAILLEARAAGTLVDDRQMGTGYLKEREHLKEIMKNVTEIHKDKNPRHYTIADNLKE